jgi:hypothetical protein
MNDQEKILSFLHTAGPSLPVHVAKHINTNILLASAHLSEIASQGKVKISHLKVGGSPLYYLPEHKEKLQNFLHNLNPKDQVTVTKLKERKLLKEKELDLFSRVSLRKIKDFAIPLNITFNDQKELFWKWYLITDSEAVEIVKFRMVPTPTTPATIPITLPTPPTPSHLPTIPVQSPKKLEKQLQPSISAAPLELEQQAKQDEQQAKQYSEEKTKLFSENEKLSNKSENGLENLKESQKDLEKSKSSQRKPLFQKLKEKLKNKRKENPDIFFPKIDLFFQKRNIKIETKETLRKNSEMNFILKVPSVVGRMSYFCKAKNKKRCDERDLSAAYMEAQSKKLPLLFLYANDLTKKAREMIESNVFENSIIKKLNQDGS